ncbi:hypothetical protein PG994_004134 [Apiospora phragmitis]|uniref:Uncharacterized protein n=1 Tax=Apiospora phragmitis TaxID=2905665 RepID=A0ABR1VST8_9PEZI
MAENASRIGRGNRGGNAAGAAGAGRRGNAAGAAVAGRGGNAAGAAGAGNANAANTNGGNAANEGNVVRLRDQLDRIEWRVAMIKRTCANVLLRVLGPNETYYQDYIGQIATPFTTPGNLDWPKIKTWVVQ